MGERMTPARVLAAAGLALVFLTSASVALAAGRVALVVGNSTYSHIARLPNPENDAADMAAALRRLGFEVTTAQDADRASLNEALRVFTRESVGANVALVFYAGHGLEMDGVNYLVPVDARLDRDTDVRFETVALDDVLAATAGASLRMVILDACRNNPLARSMQRTVARRSVSGGSFGDLNEDLLGDETLVAYAAAAGTTAADGRGRNSPYTSALLAYLEEPLELSALFRRVRGRVLESTDGQQRPHEYGSLLREHYLSRVSTPSPAAVTTADGAAVRLQQETVFWQSIRASTDPADFEAYLELFTNGTFARLARNRLAALRPEADPPRPGVRDGETFRHCPICPEMVVIPAGEFSMGSPMSEEGREGDEGPQHLVRVQRFALGRYEVTRGEYAAFAAATGRDGNGCSTLRDSSWDLAARASWRSPGFPQTDEHPAVCMSWDDARAYVRWLSQETGRNYRLPSEVEWEYAARAGTATSRYWGDGASGQCANSNGADAAFAQRWEDWTVASCNDGWVFTAPVGTFGANQFGLFDVLGNAREWVEDCWHDSYRDAPSDGRAWTSGGDCSIRALRSGAWTYTPQLLRAANRGYGIAADRVHIRGFRVASTLD